VIRRSYFFSEFAVVEVAGVPLPDEVLPDEVLPDESDAAAGLSPAAPVAAGEVPGSEPLEPFRA
jgi:hypothetical protein